MEWTVCLRYQIDKREALGAFLWLNDFMINLIITVYLFMISLIRVVCLIFAIETFELLIQLCSKLITIFKYIPHSV